MSLAPGDMAVIVAHPLIAGDPFYDVVTKNIGAHLTIVAGPIILPDCGYWNPYWRCAGVPAQILGHQDWQGVLSGKLLRRIPPAPMVEDESETKEMVT